MKAIELPEYRLSIITRHVFLLDAPPSKNDAATLFILNFLGYFTARQANVRKEMADTSHQTADLGRRAISRAIALFHGATTLRYIIMMRQEAVLS